MKRENWIVGAEGIRPFGESDECLELERVLYEETYRNPSDPALTLLRSIMEKMQ